ncbi:hypothetical protein R1flu_006262 [Riccia fluitans]|uniref:Uncharacterized protein n=1 Tax=Riccia fluitans TaxID=41844 RepID=A0ABD1YVQ6_9MARC
MRQRPVAVERRSLQFVARVQFCNHAIRSAEDHDTHKRLGIDSFPPDLDLLSPIQFLYPTVEQVHETACQRKVVSYQVTSTVHE